MIQRSAARRSRCVKSIHRHVPVISDQSWMMGPASKLECTRQPPSLVEQVRCGRLAVPLLRQAREEITTIEFVDADTGILASFNAAALNHPRSSAPRNPAATPPAVECVERRRTMK